MQEYIASIITLAITLLSVIFLNYLFKKKKMITRDKAIQQMLLFLILLIGLVIIIFFLPIPTDIKESILRFLGILAGAAIAFSSTTFIANAMSGIMLKFIKSFKVGDYIETEDTFGRVTDIQILHTQVQSIDRDLITVPNLKLVSSPLKTIRSSGTIVNTTVSLGYDIPREKIEKSLIIAAQKTDLENPFVHIMDLGDFSVTYKVGGLLKDIEGFVTARSDFKKAVMDVLHENNIEIVSPNFMNQKILKEDAVFIPPKEHKPKRKEKKAPEKKAEEIIFDKAIIAESLGKIENSLIRLEEKRKEIKEVVFGVLILPEAKEIAEEGLKENTEMELEAISQQQEDIKNEMETIIEELKSGEELEDPGSMLVSLKNMEIKLNELTEKQENIETTILKIIEKSGIASKKESSDNRDPSNK